MLQGESDMLAIIMCCLEFIFMKKIFAFFVIMILKIFNYVHVLDYIIMMFT